MLLYSSLRRELGQSFTATLIVMVTIVMTMMLIRTLSLASKGSINPQDIFAMMAYLTLSYLPILLALSLFLAIVNTFSRLYKDSEMAVWFASGQGLGGFLRPIFRFAWPTVLGIGLLSLLVWPWANTQMKELRSSFESRSDIDRITPGEFQKNKAGNRVFFTDSNSNKEKSGKIFIYSEVPQARSVTTAAGGRVLREDGSVFLELRQGQNISTRTDTKVQSISSFAQYRLRMGQTGQVRAAQEIGRTTPTPQLFSSAPGLGELFWRVGLPLCAINLLIIGLLVTRNGNRSGKSANLLLAILSFATYYNLLNYGQSQIAQGKIGFTAALLLLHGGVFLLCMILLYAKENNLRDISLSAIGQSLVTLLSTLSSRRPAP